VERRFYQVSALAGDTFAIEGCTQLFRMVGIIGNGNIFAEEWFIYAFEKAGALVGYGSGGEIVKKKTYQIEDGGRFEDYRVFSGRNFLRVFRHLGFFAGAGGKFLRGEITNVAGIGFGPTGGGFVLHGDGKFGVGLAMCGKKSLRICKRQLRLSGRKDSGGDLAAANRQIAGFFHGAGAVFGSGCRGFTRKTIHAAIALLAGHRQQARNFWLTVRKLQRRFNRGEKRIFVETIAGNASGAAVDDGSNGDGDAVFCNVLVNSIVGEARECVDGFVDLHFSFIGPRDVAQP